MNKQKIIILGAEGSLGQELQRVFVDEEIISLGRKNLDIVNEEEIESAFKFFTPDFVFNCAAYTNVDKAETNQDLANEINGLAVGNLARVSKKYNAILIQFSTGMVFDGQKEGYIEEDVPNPINAYGWSKLLGETLLQDNTDQFYLVRTCWLYGEMGNKRNFVDIMLSIADKKVNAIQNEFGSPTYTKDLARACWVMVNLKKPFGIYHITNSGVASRYDWAREIFEIQKIGKDLVKVDSSFFKREAIRPKFEVLENHEFIEMRSWQDALREYLENKLK